MNRDEWLAERSKGIGASECAAVLGLDRYRGPVDVYNSKIGLSPEVEETPAMKWGKRLEPFVADAFAERHPEYTVTWPDEYTMIWHPELRFLFCTPDRWLEPTNGGGTAGLQIKTVGTHAVRYWPDDNPPDAYLVQCIHEMMCHPGRDVWFLAALIGGQSEREYRITRDLALEREIVQRLSAFWESHVIAHVPPPLDATAASDRLLKHLYPEAGQFVRQANHEDELYLAGLAAARQRRIKAEQEECLLGNIVKERIGTDKGLEWDGGRVLWSTVAGRRSVDYKALLAELNPPAEVVERHSRIDMPTRRFTVKLNGEEK